MVFSFFGGVFVLYADKEQVSKAEEVDDDNDDDLGEERPTEVEEEPPQKDDGIPKQFKDLFMEKCTLAGSAVI